FPLPYAPSIAAPRRVTSALSFASVGAARSSASFSSRILRAISGGSFTLSNRVACLAYSTVAAMSLWLASAASVSVSSVMNVDWIHPAREASLERASIRSSTPSRNFLASATVGAAPDVFFTSAPAAKRAPTTVASVRAAEILFILLPHLQAGLYPSRAARYRSASVSSEHPGWKRELTAWDAASLTVGAVIGTAIFLTPADIGRALPH